jgi:RHS repeat-associated protein
MYSSVSTDVAYKFTGQEFDDETGLHNFRARLYDAEIGMFYAYDPAAQGFSPFGYCGNNPVIKIDKNGKIAWFVVPAIVGAVINVAANWDKVIENPLNALGFASIGAVSGMISATPGLGAIGVSIGSSLNTLGTTYLRNERVSLQSMVMSVGLAITSYGLGNLAQGKGFFDNFYGSSKVVSNSTSNITKGTSEELIDEVPTGLSDSKVAKNYLDEMSNNTSTAIEKVFPPNDGFVFKYNNLTLKEGDYLERLGSWGGNYASPLGTPFGEKSLPINRIFDQYTAFKVIKPIRGITGGPVLPWFGAQGYGWQWKFPNNFNYYINNKYIIPINK